jgi:Tfp pilus assembly PilM family ATPase
LPLAIRRGDESERRADIANELQSLDRGAHARDEFDFWDAAAAAEQQNDSAPNANVLTVAPEWAMRVADDTAYAGLRCEVLDGLPLALGRATQMAVGDRTGQPTAAVDWGFHSTTFCIVSQGQPLFVRSLRDCGLEAIVQSVCSVMEVSLDEAHVILRQHGLSAGQQDAASDELAAAITEVVSEPLARVVGELNRTLDYLKTHRPALSPGRILLFGGGATIKGVTSLLSRRIGLEVQAWRLPGATADRESAADCPPEMLGPAIALSSLAWLKS